MKLHIDIRNKVAKYRQREGSIVCGNSDYVIEFTFDSEWDAHTTKTAHFIWGGKSLDKDFTGNTCQVPTIKNATELKVGVYVGDLRTTTSAIIPCKLSTLCESTVPFTEEEKEKEYTSEAKAAAERAETAAERAEDAADRAEAAGGGGSGESGATFIPAVSSNGTISWSNDKGLQNPDPVNIKGPTGSPGANGRGIEKIYLEVEVLEDDGTTLKDYAIKYTDGNQDNIQIRDGSPGATGADGRGIERIEETASGTGTDGRMYHKYTVYYTDGEPFTFEVKDGKDGSGGGGGDTTDLEARVKTLEDKMKELTYEAIEIISFSVSPSTAEMGSTVTDPVLSWKLNKEARAVRLDGSYVSTSESAMHTAIGSYTQNKTWTLCAEDGETNEAERTTTLSFLNGVYWGVMYPGGEVNASIKALEHKELRSSHKSSFTVTAGENAHIAYCVPKRFGTRKFRIGGFEGGFESPLSVSFTNASGYTEDYYVYLSTHANLGTTTVEVING